MDAPKKRRLQLASVTDRTNGTLRQRTLLSNAVIDCIS